MSNEIEPKHKRCPKCGAHFLCTTDQGNCWCNAYSIPKENLELLKNTFSNCLCESCLGDYGTKKK